MIEYSQPPRNPDDITGAPFFADGSKGRAPVGDKDITNPAEFDAAREESEIAGTQEANDRLTARRAAGKEMLSKISGKIFGSRR